MAAAAAAEAAAAAAAAAAEAPGARGCVFRPAGEVGVFGEL